MLYVAPPRQKLRKATSVHLTSGVLKIQTVCRAERLEVYPPNFFEANENGEYTILQSSGSLERSSPISDLPGHSSG